MKLLMIQLPTSQLGAKERVYPLGLSRLSSLVPADVDKQVLDMNLCNDPWDALNTTIRKHGADIIFLSFRNLDPLAGHHASYLSSLKTAALLCKQLLPEARLLGGGPAFSLFAKRLMEEVPELDFGLAGEGELVFPELLKHSIAPANIPSLLWRDGECVIQNPSGPKITLDLIPQMDVEAFPPDTYTGSNSYVAAIGIEGKRGCDLWCGYCLYPKLGGTCMRLRPVKNIVDEMEMLKTRFGIELFHFTDSVVNRPRDHFEELCKELINRKLDVGWTGFFRENDFTAENLTLARRAGLIAIYFSADALTDYGLNLLNKRMTEKDILRAARLTADEGILTMCHFLVNLPDETDETIARASTVLDRLLDIHDPSGNLGAVIFNTIRLYPDAPLTNRLIRNGELSADTDLLYPVYYNPQKYNHVLHTFEARCHSAGVFSRLLQDKNNKEPKQ